MVDQISSSSTPDTAIIDRARVLADQLRSNAAQSHSDRRLDSADIKALSEAGLFSLCVPRRFGGLAVNSRTLVDTIAAVAYGNGAAGWVHALVNTSAFMASLLPDRAQQELFAEDPATAVCTVFDMGGTAEEVDGGWRITGRWPFASGSLHAQWALLGVPVSLDASGQALALVPMSDLTIDDTWFTAGMRGTGSNTIVADNVFVPSYRAHGFGDLVEGNYRAEHHDDALYRSAFLPVGTVVLGAPHIGMGRAALDLTMATIPNRRVKYTSYDRSADAPFVQQSVAEATSKVDAAELLLWRACADIDEAAAKGESLSRLVRARVRMDTGHAITLCRSAINELLTVNGASAFGEFNYLQQIWRDSETASRHAFAEPEIAKEIYGRELFGLDPIMPI
jgi:3-hydroxy-9,10-secoandrosta-1,3,5(10)-triene-9,17-dione monooxygenase